MDFFIYTNLYIDKNKVVMSILSELKSLSPRQRLMGFIINLVVTGFISILVAYFNYNDCTSVNKKYEETLKNYTNLIEINNNLMKELNNARRDMVEINRYVEVKVNENYNRVVKVENKKDTTFSLTGTTEPETIKIKETVTINKVPSKVIAAHDSIKNITSKYKE